MHICENTKLAILQAHAKGQLVIEEIQQILGDHPELFYDARATVAAARGGPIPISEIDKHLRHIDPE